MSKNDERKDQASDTPIFSIEFDTNNSTIPGVTQLLTPKKRSPPSGLPSKVTPPEMKIESKGPPPASPLYKTVPTPELQIPPVQMGAAPEISIRLLDDVEAPPIRIPERQPWVAPLASAKKSLAELGVHYELHFKAEGNFYRYSKMIAHQGPNFFMWQQQFYFKMKLDLKVLEIRRNFEEFTSDKNIFYADAFGLTSLKYIQIIRMDSNQNILFVLLSENSLASSLQNILELLPPKLAEKPIGDSRISTESVDAGDDNMDHDYAEDEIEEDQANEFEVQNKVKSSDQNKNDDDNDHDGDEFKIELAS